MAGPLSGVTVIDFSAYMAGPFATMILAEQGADVIKVEPLAGDPMRSTNSKGRKTGAQAFNSNRAKRSIALNIKDQRGLAIAERLIKGADVLVENFRAGVADRLGLGYEKLSADNPGLIYVRASGVGPLGPEARRPVFDSVIQAMSGLCYLQSNEDGPQIANTYAADKIAPLLLAQAVAAALYERSVSGRGQYVEQSMLHAALWWLWPDMMQTHTFTADDDDDERSPYSGKFIYATADGHLLVPPGRDEDWRALCRAMERPDMVDDERFASVDLRIKNNADVSEILTTEFAKRTTAEWKSRLTAEDAIFSIVNTPRSILTDEQVLANEMFTYLRTDTHGEIRAPTPPARFSRTPSSPGVGPELGEHTEAVLTELGLSAGEQSLLRDGGVIG